MQQSWWCWWLQGEEWGVCAAVFTQINPPVSHCWWSVVGGGSEEESFPPYPLHRENRQERVHSTRLHPLPSPSPHS